MINLLPPEEKRNLEREVQVQKIILLIWCVLIGFLGLIVFFFVFSWYIGIKGVQSIEKMEMVEGFFYSGEFTSFQEKIRQANKQAAQFTKFLEAQPSVISMLERLTRAIPPGIYFNNLVFTKKGPKEASVSISGKSDTREHLYFFKENLEKEPNFKDVQFQLSSWIKPQDADFSLTFFFETK